MANNPWDQVGNSIDEGINTGLNIQRIKMEKQKMAQEAIKAKFEMMQKNYEHAWQVVRDPQLPGSTKVQYWNHIIAPYDNNVMGMKTPEMTKWNDELQSHVEQAAHVMDLVADGKLTVKEGKLAYNHIQAEVASNPQASTAFKGIDKTLEELSGAAPASVNVGGKTVMASKNINGTYDPIKVNGMGNAVAPSQLSVDQQKNKLDAFNTAKESMLKSAQLITADKNGTLDQTLKSLGMGKLTPDEIQQALNVAHSNMYITGGQIGLSNKDITGIISGKLDSTKVLTEAGKKFALPGVDAAPAPADSTITVNPSFLKNADHPLATPAPKDPTLSMGPADESAPVIAQASNASGVIPPSQDPEQLALNTDPQKDEANV